MDKKMQKSRATKLNLTISGTTYLLIHAKKRHFIPVPPDQQGTDLVTEQSIDLAPTPSRHLSSVKHKKLHQACVTFCLAHHVIEDTATAATIILLLLLSRIMDLALLKLPGVPVILVRPAMVIPAPLRALTGALCGPEEIWGKGLHIRRPTCVEAVLSLGATAPPTDLEHYLGGYYRNYYGKKQYLWLPLQNTSSILAPNLPRAVSKTVISYSPLMIPIIFGTDKALIGDRPTFKFDGTAFTTFNPKILKNLEKCSTLIQLELESFVKWFRAKRTRQSRWLDEAEIFLPKSQRGQFVQFSTDVKDYALALAMSLLKQFLHFSIVEKRSWLTEDEAQQFLTEYWRLVLPESAPVTRVGDDRPAGKWRWNDPLTFWTFLSVYIGEYAAKLSADGAPVKRETVGVLHKLPDGISYLIFPRGALLQAYVLWLQERHIDTPQQSGRWETQVQSAIMNWGIPVKHESRDISWRFAFYLKGQAPVGMQEKLACLAFPLDQLPPEIITALESALGPAFSPWNPEHGFESKVAAYD